MDFYALIEEWPHESLVNFRELPGCLVTGPTVEEALQNTPQAITEYLSWLKQNNIFFLTEEVGAINVVLKERIRADQVGPRFASELLAPTEQEMDSALTVAATARALLVDLYNEVSPAQRSRALKPDEWSLADHLQHILQSEAHYVGCLNDQLPEDVPSVSEGELANKLLENGQSYERFLRSLTPEQRTHVYIHGKAEWTVAKVLRRVTEHLRDHYPWVQAIVRQLQAV